MDKVNLKWFGPFDFYGNKHNAEVLNKSVCIYMILDSELGESKNRSWDSELLYIGMVYNQPVWERILQHGRSELERWIDKEAENYVKFKVAIIEPLTMRRITKELVEDIEVFTIYSYEPAGNIRNCLTYNGSVLPLLEMEKTSVKLTL